MSVEYADGKNQHKLHNLQCLDKKPTIQILKKNIIVWATHSGLKGEPILHLCLNFNRTALNCYFIDK